MRIRKKILLVDDSFINRGILRAILEDEYDLLEAENGQQALEIVEEENGAISAVLLDILMPVMDGYAFLKILKENHKYMNIPVIVMTQNNGDEEEIKALTMGAADFLTKPYKAMIIRQRLANMLQLQEAAALRNLVEQDPLTGVLNCDTFYRKVSEGLEVNQDKKYDMICLDIEKFKLINDIFGVPEGDKLLRFLGERLKEESLKLNGLAARLGNDIFAFCMQRSPVCEQKLILSLVNDMKNYPLNIAINLRFGIYCIHDVKMDVSGMCDRAKLAIDSIKGKYDQIYAYYEDEQRQKLLREQEILNDMYDALQQEQFEVYLQPKFNLKTNMPDGAEALVRWKHPEKGIISPGEFIPIFEKNGFIMKLDYYMWDKVCGLLRRWMDEGRSVRPVSVNVSRVNLYNPKLCETLVELTRKYDIAPQLLNLELTESAYMDNPEALIHTMKRLQNYGFVIMMDDFGSGYSSLNILKDIPVDVLKIDLKFLSGEDTSGRGASILSSVVEMAAKLDLPAIAEGVETKEQSDFLLEIGCFQVQGFYYARPMPVAEYEQKILQKYRMERISRR